MLDFSLFFFRIGTQYFNANRLLSKQKAALYATYPQVSCTEFARVSVHPLPAEQNADISLCALKYKVDDIGTPSELHESSA